jgi:hypothetical protein
MAEERRVNLAALVDEYFARYTPTFGLVDRLTAERAYQREVLLMLTARLDSLARSSVAEGTAAQKSFQQFLRRFAPDSATLQQVSVGDLYGDLSYREDYLLEGMIQKAGRILRFSSEDDAFIDLLWKSEIALTFEESASLFRRVMAALAATYRVKEQMPQDLALSDDRERVADAIISGVSSPESPEVFLRPALQRLLDTYTLSSILYREFRSAAIHEVGAGLDDEGFYVKTEPYWVYRSRLSAGEDFMSVQFPAAYLRSQLEGCIARYRDFLVRREKLPAPIFFELFDEPAAFDDASLDRFTESLRYLDDETIGEAIAATGLRQTR